MDRSVHHRDAEIDTGGCHDGVISAPLGTGAIDRVMRQRFLPSGRVPSSEVDDDHVITRCRRVTRFGSRHVASSTPPTPGCTFGAGKTGMDAGIWLIENGADPAAIRWIMPRDSWVLNRANVQPSEDGFARMCQSIADRAEAVALADSVDEARFDDEVENRICTPIVPPTVPFDWLRMFRVELDPFLADAPSA